MGPIRGSDMGGRPIRWENLVVADWGCLEDEAELHPLMPVQVDRALERLIV